MRTSNTKIWTLGAVILFVVGLAYVRAAEVAKDDAANRDGAMAAAAQKTYDEMFRSCTVGEFSDLDEMYRWSRRTLDAESRVGRGKPRALRDAAMAHEKRMQDLDGMYRKLADGGQMRKSAASEYYLLEAKALVADASHGQ